MAAAVVTVGRQSYAVGLYWENSPGGGRVAQIAKEAAVQSGQQAEFFAVRPGNKNGRIPQFGLTSGERNDKLKSGMPVLAGSLAGQLPGSWAGAFRLNEGTILIIVRDDLIVPDGDLFFADETEARDRLLQEIGFGGLQGTYAPESWSIPGADSIPLSLLLNDRRDVKLQAVRMSERTKIIALAGAAAFILILGAAWYWQEMQDEERLRVAEQQEALRRAQQAAAGMLPSFQKQQAPEPVYVKKWQTEPVAMQVIENCRAGLARVPAGWAGWRLSTIRCNGSSIDMVWARERGASNAPDQAIVNDVGSSATKNIALPALNPRGEETLVDPSVVTEKYLARAWPGVISRMAEEPPPPPPPNYNGPWNPPPPPWVKRSFTLTVPELPAQLADMLGDLPGVVITSASLAATGLKSNWTIEGVIYENRK